jgi:hypothetical protein
MARKKVFLKIPVQVRRCASKGQSRKGSKNKIDLKIHAQLAKLFSKYCNLHISEHLLWFIQVFKEQ